MTDALHNIEASRAAMVERYPSLEFSRDEHDGEPVGMWEGWLQPIRSRADLNKIVCDLDADRQIMIDRETASIRHAPRCTVNHKKHRVFNLLKRPDRAFRVRIEYTGGQEHPQAWLLDPAVTPRTRMHIFGENRICAYPPQANVWRAEDHNVADFTHHVLVWTFKWNTWVETGYWLGSEEDHDPFHLVSSIRPDSQCWCGTGKTYGECCRPNDARLAGLEMQVMLWLRSPLRQVPRIDRSSSQTLSGFLSAGNLSRR